MTEDNLCCAHGQDRAHPHYAGDLRELMTVADRSGIAVQDIRGSSSLAVLLRLYEDARARYFSQGYVDVSDVRVLVIDDGALSDPAVCSAVTDIVAQVRWQGLYLWIDSTDDMPPGIAVQLVREHCNLCTIRGLSEAMEAGVVL